VAPQSPGQPGGALLLRSPMHPLLSRSLVILSYQGRKTGRWRSLPCMYARNGQEPLHHPWPARPQGLGGATCADPDQSPCVCEAATWEAPPPPAATLRPSPPACTTTWPAIPRPPRPLGSTGRQRRLAWYGPGGSSAGRGHRPPESSLAVDAPLPRTCPSRVLSSGGPTALLDHYALEDAREQR
jgi:hypothetical protein